MYYAIKLVIPGRTAVGMVGVFVFVVVSASTIGTEIGNTIAANSYASRSIFDQNGTFIEDELKAGSNIPARIAMIAITTKSSISVNCFFIFTLSFFLG